MVQKILYLGNIQTVITYEEKIDKFLLSYNKDNYQKWVIQWKEYYKELLLYINNIKTNKLKLKQETYAILSDEKFKASVLKILNSIAQKMLNQRLACKEWNKEVYKQILYSDIKKNKPYFGYANDSAMDKNRLEYYRNQRERRGFDDTEVHLLSYSIIEYFIWLYENKHISNNSVLNTQLYHMYKEYMFYGIECGSTDSKYYDKYSMPIDRETINKQFGSTLAHDKYIKQFLLNNECPAYLKFINDRLQRLIKVGISGQYINTNYINDVFGHSFAYYKQSKDINKIILGLDLLQNVNSQSKEQYSMYIDNKAIDKAINKALDLFADKYHILGN